MAGRRLPLAVLLLYVQTTGGLLLWSWGHYDNSDGMQDGIPVDKDFYLRDSMTILFWAKSKSCGCRQNPWNGGYGGEGSITFEPSGRVSYYYGSPGDNNSPYQGFGLGNVKINYDGGWRHYAIVRDLSAMRLRGYMNGNHLYTGTCSYSYAGHTSFPKTLGHGYAGRFRGQLHDLQVHNVALSTAQIQAIMAENNPDNACPTTRPPHHIMYNFNDGAFRVNPGSGRTFSSTQTRHTDKVWVANWNSGWSSGRKGWLSQSGSTSLLTLKGLSPNTKYRWTIYQWGPTKTNKVTVNGGIAVNTVSSYCEKTASTGEARANPAGWLEFVFTRSQSEVVLSGLGVDDVNVLGAPEEAFCDLGQPMTHHCFEKCELIDEYGTMHATLKNGASCSIGTGVRLDGSNDYIDLKDQYLQGSLSFSFWVDPDQVGNGRPYSRVLDFGNGQGSWNILISHYGSSSHQIYIEAFNGVSKMGPFVASSMISTSGLFHIVGTWSSSGRIRLYSNNVLRKEWTSQGAIGLARRTNSWIGRSNWGSHSYYDGLIRAFSIFDYELSEQDVDHLYRNGVSDRCFTIQGPAGVIRSQQHQTFWQFWGYSDATLGSSTVYTTYPITKDYGKNQKSLRMLLQGWTHIRQYNHGYLRNTNGEATATVEGLRPNTEYDWHIYATTNKATGQYETNRLRVKGGADCDPAVYIQCYWMNSNSFLDIVTSQTTSHGTASHQSISRSLTAATDRNGVLGGARLFNYVHWVLPSFWGTDHSRFSEGLTVSFWYRYISSSYPHSEPVLSWTKTDSGTGCSHPSPSSISLFSIPYNYQGMKAWTGSSAAMSEYAFVVMTIKGNVCSNEKKRFKVQWRSKMYGNKVLYNSDRTENLCSDGYRLRFNRHRWTSGCSNRVKFELDDVLVIPGYRDDNQITQMWHDSKSESGSWFDYQANKCQSPVATGRTKADYDGKMQFVFSRTNGYGHMILSGLGMRPAPFASCETSRPAHPTMWDLSWMGSVNLNSGSTYSRTSTGYTIRMTGWTHARTYHKGLLRNTGGTATVYINNLSPNRRYHWFIYAYCDYNGFNVCGPNYFTVHGKRYYYSPTWTKCIGTASAHGTSAASSTGEIRFQFTRVQAHVGVSAVALQFPERYWASDMKYCGYLQWVDDFDVLFANPENNADRKGGTINHDGDWWGLRDQNFFPLQTKDSFFLYKYWHHFTTTHKLSVEEALMEIVPPKRHQSDNTYHHPLKLFDKQGWKWSLSATKGDTINNQAKFPRLTNSAKNPGVHIPTIVANSAVTISKVEEFIQCGDMTTGAGGSAVRSYSNVPNSCTCSQYCWNYGSSCKAWQYMTQGPTAKNCYLKSVISLHHNPNSIAAVRPLSENPRAGSFGHDAESMWKYLACTGKIKK